MLKGPNFLVVGLERSGTHWVASLLNAHPEVACIPLAALYGWQEKYQKEFFGEIHLFNTLASLELGNEEKFVRPLDSYLTTHNKYFADLVVCRDQLPKEKLYALFIERYNQLCEMHRQSKKIVGESTPAYIFHLDFIDHFYPQIKKVCIIRDPKDRVVSWHFNQIKKQRKIDTKITNEFIRDYCEKRIKKEYENMLNYSGKIFCFTYESLSDGVRTPHVVANLLDYLAVDSNYHIIKKMIEEADFKKVSTQDNDAVARERGQELLTSHYRKGMVGDWQNYLTIEQAKIIDEIIGNLQNQVFAMYEIKNN